MPTFTVPKGAIAKGPGTLFWAPPGTALPDYSVAGSLFSVNAWTGWFLLGITKSGSDWTYDLKQDDVLAAEYLDALDVVSSGRTFTAKFELMQINATNLVRALNRPTPATTGAGATLRTTVKAPALGAELYCMIGWQSTDDTERIVGQNCINTGAMAISRNKGADVGTLACQFRFLPDANGDPFLWDFAGTNRG